jgi:deoxyribonuclease-4
MQTMILLEHTAGQGSNLGHRFEHLASIIGRLDGSPRIGVCLDTCHLLAAGYDLCSAEGFEATFRDFDRTVGIDRIRAFNLNDSKRPCGSRVDRHEQIGKGCLGLEPFRRLLNDPRFARLPMLLETPKLDTPESRRRSDADPWDLRNLRALRRLLPRAAPARARRI